MRLCQILCRQHLTRQTKFLWKVRRNQIVVPYDNNIEKLGLPIEDPSDVVREEIRKIERIEVIGYRDRPIPYDENHPAYQNKVCYTYKDKNVLVEGLDQAKLLTKTVEIEEGLPESVLKYENISVDPEVDNLVKRCIMSSHLFDAYQELLPRLKDPNRPAWNFPRSYGITDTRRNVLISSKLLNLCENLYPELAKDRMVSKNINVNIPLQKDEDLIRFNLRLDLLLTSASTLPEFTSQEVVDSVVGKELPNLYPFSDTISLEEEHFYDTRVIITTSPFDKYRHLHTAIVFYNETEVGNLFGTPVTERQIYGRTLLKSFALAAAYSCDKYGEYSVNKNPMPPCRVQCIHTNGKWFQFSVFQLNTLDLKSGPDRNIFWTTPLMPMFSSCSYEQGRPVLKDYNPEVFRKFLAFYVNGMNSSDE